MILEVKTFGYTSNDDVKGQYDSCMMKGEVEKICKLLCSKISASDHGIDHESDNQCDKCRGSLRIQCDGPSDGQKIKIHDSLYF